MDKKLDYYMASKIMEWYYCTIPFQEPFWSVSPTMTITTKRWAPTMNAGQADLCLSNLKLSGSNWRWLVTNHSEVGYKVCLRAPYRSTWNIIVEHKSREMAICLACKKAKEEEQKWSIQDKKEQEQKLL